MQKFKRLYAVEQLNVFALFKPMTILMSEVKRLLYHFYLVGDFYKLEVETLSEILHIHKLLCPSKSHWF